MAEARRTGRLPDVLQLPMASAHAYARDGTLDADAAQDVVDQLGEETFSARALSLLTSEGKVIAVPSDGWGQLLIYRRDLFAAAGLDAPRTLEDVRRAARRLHGDGMAGITLATDPSHFTAETFEHVALAAGCQLLGDGGEVTLRSPECEYAFDLYLDLARNASVRGRQDVDSTRATYFAGRAAMVFWSPFLLDAMAGLRDDARAVLPAVPARHRVPRPQERARRARWPGRAAQPAQYGTVSTWGITANADLGAAQRFVDYMMSDGYLDWLALSPQGKYPVRFGDRSDPERYVDGLGRAAERRRAQGAAAPLLLRRLDRVDRRRRAQLPALGLRAGRRSAAGRDARFGAGRHGDRARDRRRRERGAGGARGTGRGGGRRGEARAVSRSHGEWNRAVARGVLVP